VVFDVALKQIAPLRADAAHHCVLSERQGVAATLLPCLHGPQPFAHEDGAEFVDQFGIDLMAVLGANFGKDGKAWQNAGARVAIPAVEADPAAPGADGCPLPHAGSWLLRLRVRDRRILCISDASPESDWHLGMALRPSG